MSRKEDILKAAMELFARDGYSATSTAAIARAAGVAEGLLFHHFQNKAGVLVAMLTEMADAYILESEAVIQKAQTGLDALEQVLRHHFRFGEERRAQISALFRDLPSDLVRPGSSTAQTISGQVLQMAGMIKRCLDKGIKDKTIRDLDSEQTAWIIRGMLNGIIRLENELGLVPDAAWLAEETVAFCVRSVVKPRTESRKKPDPKT